MLVCRQTVLSFSDAHLVSGLATLIAGYMQFKSITIYHFNTVIYLAWLSSSVHLVTLVICRSYFRLRPARLAYRLVGMTILFILLLTALIQSASMTWPTASYRNNASATSSGGAHYFYFDTPMRCQWTCGHMERARFVGLISILLIVYGFAARIIKVFPFPSTLVRIWLREKPSSYYIRCCGAAWTRKTSAGSAPVRWYWTAILYLLLYVYILARANVDILESNLSALVGLTMTLIWGGFRLLVWREASLLSQYENPWGFGQILAILLLMGPLLNVLGLYKGSTFQYIFGASIRSNAQQVRSSSLPYWR